MSDWRENHYVPVWYQKGFLKPEASELEQLNLKPDTITLPNGTEKDLNAHHTRHPKQCFCERDLYTTHLGSKINTDIEKQYFGSLDNTGARAVKAFIGEDVSEWTKHFSNFFTYIDGQRTRTPKGLNWIKQHFSGLDQNHLMQEMQAIRNMHCTIWTEGVREVVSAEKSEIKFIVSDNPVTIYNYALPPEHQLCGFPNDPDILLKATQTIFPMDGNHCLILTNLEYARDNLCPPLEKRSYAQHFRNTLVRTDRFVRKRVLLEDEVATINYILKKRAQKYIAAGQKEWLFPDEMISGDWSSLSKVLLPPDDVLNFPAGETIIGYEDGTTAFQDEFGRATPENTYLNKKIPQAPLHPLDECGCGSGFTFKDCCKNKPEHLRSSWKVLSIRERNLAFCRGIRDYLGFEKGKNWFDARDEISAETVKKIHELYGFLWPAETDILDLLPKPDAQRLRVVYSGVIDARVISQCAISVSPYFDEMIIQSPFTNPNSVKPEFSPVENPQKFIRQTLLNVRLLLEMEPFIEMGKIHLIPDVCNFDSHLQWEALSLADKRKSLLPMEEEDSELLMKLQMDTFKRSMFNLPDKFLRNKLKEIKPETSDEMMNAVISHIRRAQKEDLYSTPNMSEEDFGDGSFYTFHLAPNLEVALFLSQITGAVLLTDNSYRFKEFNLSALMNKSTPPRNIFEKLNPVNIPVHEMSFRTFDLCYQQKFRKMRYLLRQLPRLAEQKTDLTDKFIKKINNAERSAITDSKAAASGTEFERFNVSNARGITKLGFFAPEGGIQHPHAQRLLLPRGGTEVPKQTPMAIYMKHPWNYGDS